MSSYSSNYKSLNELIWTKIKSHGDKIAYVSQFLHIECWVKKDSKIYFQFYLIIKLEINFGSLFLPNYYSVNKKNLRIKKFFNININIYIYNMRDINDI